MVAESAGPCNDPSAVRGGHILGTWGNTNATGSSDVVARQARARLTQALPPAVRAPTHLPGW